MSPRRRMRVDEWRRTRHGPWHAFTGRSEASQCMMLERPIDGDGPKDVRGQRRRDTPPPPTQPLCTACAKAIGFSRRKGKVARTRLLDLPADLRKVARRAARAIKMNAQAGHELAVAAKRTAREALRCTREDGPCRNHTVVCANCLARRELEAAIRRYQDMVPAEGEDDEEEDDG